MTFKYNKGRVVDGASYGLGKNNKSMGIKVFVFDRQYIEQMIGESRLKEIVAS